MSRILVFNPETEYALASGASFYTPPAVVDKFRKANQLLPEAWAGVDDIILVDDVKATASSFSLVDWSGLEQLCASRSDLVFEPWGWNHALRRRLTDAGVPASMLPSVGYIDRLRELAHRRTTILLNTLWNTFPGNSSCIVDVPVELYDEESAMAFCEANPGCWLKAPWSSSGRGVINTAADMEAYQIRQWCHGIIRRQGSVMGETCARKIADFASEWRMSDGEATFLGLSSFTTSNRGKYIENHTLSQNEILQRLEKLSLMKVGIILERQKAALENLMGDYSGLLGVDMMLEQDGGIRPFVEVNLRRTMGMLYIDVYHSGLTPAPR